jgi:glycosyltransferase involved in cell wall biosynthesis
MRLLHLTTIPVTLAFLRGQAACLRRRGIDVHALSSPGADLVGFARDEQVTAHAVGMARQVAPLRDLVALWRVWRALRHIRPDVVDAHTPKAGLVGMLAAALARTPVRIYHMHGLRFVTMRGWKRQLLRVTERISCALAHRVLAVSPSVRALAVRERLCRPEKVKVLLQGSMCGVDAIGRFRPQPGPTRCAMRSAFGVPSDALVLGFVGRLARDKGMAELAAAWSELRSDPRLHLLLVGDLDAADAPPHAVMDALHVDPRVHWAGHVPDTVPLYAAMDVVALPSYREGLPQVAIEAAAMALPVVATMACGCVDAVEDGTTGTLVALHDAAALARAVRTYLADAALRARHGAAARERVLAAFSPAALWAALATEYEELLCAAPT